MNLAEMRMVLDQNFQLAFCVHLLLDELLHFARQRGAKFRRQLSCQNTRRVVFGQIGENLLSLLCRD